LQYFTYKMCGSSEEGSGNSHKPGSRHQNPNLKSAICLAGPTHPIHINKPIKTHFHSRSYTVCSTLHTRCGGQVRKGQTTVISRDRDIRTQIRKVQSAWQAPHIPSTSTNQSKHISTRGVTHFTLLYIQDVGVK
jgi:hypothetical protein